jgi:hypothetical protein
VDYLEIKPDPDGYLRWHWTTHWIAPDRYLGLIGVAVQYIDQIWAVGALRYLKRMPDQYSLLVRPLCHRRQPPTRRPHQTPTRDRPHTQAPASAVPPGARRPYWIGPYRRRSALSVFEARAPSFASSSTTPFPLPGNPSECGPPRIPGHLRFDLLLELDQVLGPRTRCPRGADDHRRVHPAHEPRSRPRWPQPAAAEGDHEIRHFRRRHFACSPTTAGDRSGAGRQFAPASPAFVLVAPP